MSLESAQLDNPSTTSPPSDQADSSPEDRPAELPNREWLRMMDVCLVFLRGTPQVASWMAGSLSILSVSDPTATPRSTWYLSFVPQDQSSQHPHTIDLSTRPWRVSVEERSCALAFELGDVREGDSLRYFVKTGSKKSFNYFISYIAYIKACRVGALAEAQ